MAFSAKQHLAFPRRRPRLPDCTTSNRSCSGTPGVSRNSRWVQRRDKRYVRPLMTGRGALTYPHPRPFVVANSSESRLTAWFLDADSVVSTARSHDVVPLGQ